MNGMFRRDEKSCFGSFFAHELGEHPRSRARARSDRATQKSAGSVTETVTTRVGNAPLLRVGTSAIEPTSIPIRRSTSMKRTCALIAFALLAACGKSEEKTEAPAAAPAEPAAA